ncbi:hypothetical protein BD289DRAFT_426703 [Coniella lustricola]|uniref:Uncharacterized protein n=1 Tax=Coniella lustricola TaxID=2025994 RepID=A0A2T3AFR3_9PEZI|nr:hypothetical protein BD289DRAFT_426703 [Coniella lustricola]
MLFLVFNSAIAAMGTPIAIHGVLRLSCRWADPQKCATNSMVEIGIILMVKYWLSTKPFFHALTSPEFEKRKPQFTMLETQIRDH